MTFIADLHIHSRFSRATSQDLCFEELHRWGRRKGIALIGTGDCTHPGWLAEMREKLLPAGDGIYRLRDATLPAEPPPSDSGGAEPRFLLTGEISTIYKADAATRKVHHLVCLPGMEEAERFAARLARLGNIASDGRPILGLDSRDLLEVLLEAAPEAALIPAHIWTPWFSALGSKSGFDSIDACYRDLGDRIFALETGLSSDPPMNWSVSSLDRYALVSNSDAHSPGKLGREANVFAGEIGYTAVIRALKRETPDFLGTLEFFPEEGKYHYDGHRKCEFRCDPEESRRLHGRCPRCGGPLTLGVEYRVTELADRPRGVRPAGAFPFQSLLSLGVIIGEVLDCSPTSKRAVHLYETLLARVGPELHILREADRAVIAAAGGEFLARAVEKMRTGQVHAAAGYDGEYGSIRIFDEAERAAVLGQIRIFGDLAPAAAAKTLPAVAAEPAPVLDLAQPHGPSEEQARAVNAPPGPLLITAGPGAGKTHTLVERIARLAGEGGVNPFSILTLTFSNRAARELAERLAVALPAPARPAVATFHRLGFRMIADHAPLLGLPDRPRVLAEDEAEDLLAAAAAEGADDAATRLDALERAMAAVFAGASGDPADLRRRAEEARGIAPAYAAAKRERGALDFPDLLLLPLLLLAGHDDLLRQYRKHWRHVFVDEYQDVNVFQYLLLRLFCPPGSSLCVIGDPDQAIYGFRGADVGYFLRFRQDYPGATEVALTRNYRSSRTIVAAGSQVIAAGDPGRRRALWSSLPGPAIEVAALPTPAAEAEYVVQAIEALLGGISHFSVDSGRGGDGTGHNLGFGDIAVLYRTHALGEAVLQALERRGIPCQRTARRDLLRHPRVRALLARLGELPPGTDLSPTRAVLEACAALGIAGDTLEEPHWVALLQRAGVAESVPAFLQEIALERDIDLFDPRAARVTLMTVHAAKGLEWDAVFLLGCDEGAFPHPASTEAEERRLFYVGMTRARRHLFLSRAAARTLRGERAARAASPFLADIEEALLHRHAPDIKRPLQSGQLAMTDLVFEE